MTDETRPASAPGSLETAEEDEQPRKASALRFFLLPLLVVGTAVAIFLVFNLITFDRRSPSEYLQEVRGGGPNRRWQAAFELSRSIGRVANVSQAARRVKRDWVTSCWPQAVGTGKSIFSQATATQLQATNRKSDLGRSAMRRTASAARIDRRISPDVPPTMGARCFSLTQ